MSISLAEKIQSDLKTAMKSRDTDTVRTLRMLQAAVKNRAIETQGELADADVIRLVQTGIKQRKEAASQFRTAGRDELVAQEEAEARVLEAYLPEQLSEEELKRLVETAISDLSASGMKDMGAVMKKVMASCGGQAEGAVISALVREQLA